MNISWRESPRTFLTSQFLLLPTIVFSGQAFAVVGESEPPEIFNTAYLFQVFGSLVLVFGCLFGLAFLLRKFNGMPMSDRKLIQIVGSAKVGSREKILLLKAGELELLVGVAAGSVRTLHVFDEAQHSQQKVNDESTNDFAALLASSAPETSR